eukprot:scaffold399312_cov32-Prasinocladus_malaysianus.AAC.1
MRFIRIRIRIKVRGCLSRKQNGRSWIVQAQAISTVWQSGGVAIVERADRPARMHVHEVARHAVARAVERLRNQPGAVRRR